MSEHEVTTAPPEGDAHHSHVPVHYPPRTGLILGVAALLVTVGLGGAFYWVNHRRVTQELHVEAQTLSEANEAPVVNVVTVQPASNVHLLSLPGEARAWSASTIYARVSGYLKKWCADIGDEVKEGQVLAIIETPELDQQLAAAKARVQADRAQIGLAEARQKFCQVTLARFKDAPKGVVSDLERDEKQADFETATAKLHAAQADLAVAQAEVDRLQAMLSFAKVTAPFDGVITERHTDIGDLVTAGSTANTTALFRITQSKKVRVFVDVPQELAPRIHAGDAVSATAREYPRRSFDGVVARTSRAINRTTKNLRVEVDVHNDDLAILPGMYLQVQLQTRARHPALQIPASAMSFRTGGPQVAIVGPDGKVTFRNVRIHRDLGTLVEIRDGLAPHERVALNISNQVVEGDVVKAVELDLPAVPVPVPASTQERATAAAAEQKS